MSQWTHLNAAIRFDGIPGMSLEPELGNTTSYEDGEDAWDKCDVPCGSEGSIQYSEAIAGDGMVWKSVHIWGDLRDYEDAKSIKDYLSRIVKGQMIRSGIAHIDVEGSDSIILFYDKDASQWVSR